MSERYGPCTLCDGKGYTADNPWTECPRCEGTGQDGSVITKLQKEADEDWERWERANE